MRIHLEGPYKNLYKMGYLVTNKEPRRNVILYNSPTDRTTVSYARYLMSVHLNRFLDENEYVDHINENKLDDRIENYQILTNQENIIKNLRRNNKTKMMVELICGGCGGNFSKAKNQTHLVKGTKTTYCYRKCIATASRNGYCESKVIREYRE